MLRVKAGFSTYEIECAKLGVDYREVFEQRSREEAKIKELNLPINLDATAKGKGGARAVLKSAKGDNQGNAATDNQGAANAAQ